MKCHAGIEFPSGKPCPKCNAKLGDVCWPGINADLLELARLRVENERLRSAAPSLPVADSAGEAFEALRELEVAWLTSQLCSSIANLGYPVGMGIEPNPEQIKKAATTLFDRYAKMIAMARSTALPADVKERT